MVKPVAIQVTEEVDGKRVVIFTGNGRLSSDMKTFAVAGKFDVTFGRAPAPQPIMAKLRCEGLTTSRSVIELRSARQAPHGDVSPRFTFGTRRGSR